MAAVSENVSRRRNPFVGPRAIEYGEPIFGREHETRKLTNLILANRILLLYSPSGAGKSSLVQAALIPRLEERNFHVLPTIRVNLSPPADMSAPRFGRYTFSALTSLEEGRSAADRLPTEELSSLSLDQYLGRLEHKRVLLIFDQFEEILTADLMDREAKLDFFEQLGDALSIPNRWALFAIREDFLGGLEPFLLPVPTRLKHTFRLDLLDRQAARLVIQKTASEGGVDFTEEAASRLIDDLAGVKVQLADGRLESRVGRYIEPVHLQVVCSHLWDQHDPGDPDITIDDLTVIGSVDDSLAFYYAGRVASASVGAGVSERAVRAWFENQLITESGIRSQVMMEPDLSAGLSNDAIQKLVDAHLVRRETRQNAIWFELAHDRLIEPIRRSNAAWFDANLRVLQRQAAQWQRENQPEHLLLRGTTLSVEEGWAADHPEEITSVDQAFLEASQAARQKEEDAERLEAEMRRSRTQRTILSVVVLGLLVAILLAIYSAFQTLEASRQAQTAVAAEANARIQQANAETQQAIAETERAFANEQRDIASTAQATAEALRGTAEAQGVAEAEQRVLAEVASDYARQQASLAYARQLAAQGRGLLDVDTRLAAHLAVASSAITSTWENSSLLLELALRTGGNTIQEFGVPIPSQESPIYAIALSPDRQRLAWGTLQGYVAVWNYQTGRIEWRFRDHRGIVLSLAFSPDGRWLASGGVREGELFVWDVTSGDLVHILETDNRVYGLAFHPTQPWLAAVNLNHIRIFNIETWDEIREMRFEVEPDWIRDIAWSPDGDRLAGAGFVDEMPPNRGLVVWDTDTRQPILPFSSQASLYSAAWSPDGQLLAAGSTDGRVVIVDILTRRELDTGITSIDQDVRAVAFSPDGQVLVRGGEDQAITVFSVDGYAEIGKIPPGSPPQHIWDLEFFPLKGFGLLAAAQNDDQTATYNVGLYLVSPDNPLSTRLTAGEGEVHGIAVQQDGSLRLLRIVSGRILVSELSADPQAAASGETILLDLPGEFTSATLSSSGNRLAVRDRDNQVTVYALPSGELLSATEFDQPVSSLALDEEGGTLAIGYCAPEVAPELVPCAPGIHFRLGRVPLSLFPDLEFGADEAPVSALTFGSTSEFFASGDLDGGVEIWRLFGPDTRASEGGRVITRLTRHKNPVTSLAVSPDGTRLASGSLDNTLILWDLETRQPIGTALLGAQLGVTSLAYRDDGTLLAGYANGWVLAWDVRPERWVEIACSLAGESLSSDEQAQYFSEEQAQNFPDGDYQDFCGDR